MIRRPLALVCLSVPLVWVSTLNAWDDEPRDVSGTWVAQDSAFTFQVKDEAIHVTEIDKGQTAADFDCNIMGRDCKVKRDGHAVTVTMWFSGPALVELTSRGATVVKRRFEPSAKGDTMELQVIPVVPSGKTETFTLVRKDAQSDKK
jgi:hypothetical protein